MAIYDIDGNPIAISDDGGVVEPTPENTNFFAVAEGGINSGGVKLQNFPVGWSGDENWLRCNNGSVIGNLINGLDRTGAGQGFLYTRRAFTGTVWIRGLAKTTATKTSYCDYMVITKDKDFVNNPTYDNMESLAFTESWCVFEVDGKPNQQYLVKNDGDFEQIDNLYVTASDHENGVGVVKIVRFDIPDGYVGFLGTAVNQSSAFYQDGWNAVFPYNIDENPVITVSEEQSNFEQLRVSDEYHDGFMRFILQSDYFRIWAKDNLPEMLPMTVYPQTYNKSLYVGGDSLHNYSGGDGKHVNGFITHYNKHFGFKTVVNAGYAGSTWSGTTGGGGIKRVTDLVAADVPYDVFILAWGTNDDAGGNGMIDDEASNADGCTMVSAMKWCINQLRATFRYSAIGIIIPPPKFSNDGMKERGDLMIQVCEQLHVPYVDMRKYLSVDDLSSDGVHLGYGANKYGAAEAKLILDICPYGDPL